MLQTLCQLRSAPQVTQDPCAYLRSRRVYGARSRADQDYTAATNFEANAPMRGSAHVTVDPNRIGEKYYGCSPANAPRVPSRVSRSVSSTACAQQASDLSPPRWTHQTRTLYSTDDPPQTPVPRSARRTYVPRTGSLSSSAQGAGARSPRPHRTCSPPRGRACPRVTGESSISGGLGGRGAGGWMSKERRRA
jgi:hypothetical protein